MKVLVALTDAADVADDFEIEGTRIDERYLEYDVNEWDEYAVEEAVQLAESGVAEEVITVTIGPGRVEESIRKGLAKGPDRAIRIWDDGLADRDLLDVSTKADLLAGVVAEEEPALVLTGVQAHDDSFGATGVALAESVGYEWAAVVNDLDLDGEIAHVHRELEGGMEEVTDVDLPAVLTIQTGINEPRYASLRGIRAAQSKEIDVRSPADLDVAVDEATLRLTEMYEPTSESETIYVEGSPPEQASAIADVLREKGVGG